MIRLELLGMVGLILLVVMGLFGYTKCWGERVLFFVFLFSLGNLVLVWWFKGVLYLLPLCLSLVGFLMALPRKEEKMDLEEEVKKEEPYSEVFESPAFQQDTPVTHPGVEIIEEEAAVKKSLAKKATHSPGRYVASKMSNVYHEPKCEWAKKIVKSRQIWFKDRREATHNKYKAHSCVK